MISENSIIKRSDKHLYSSIDDEAVILGLKSGNYYGLNMTGSEIWEKLEKKVRVGDLISGFASEFPEETEAIRKDVLSFLSNLYDKGLIELADENI